MSKQPEQSDPAVEAATEYHRRYCVTIDEGIALEQIIRKAYEPVLAEKDKRIAELEKENAIMRDHNVKLTQRYLDISLKYGGRFWEPQTVTGALYRSPERDKSC